MKGKNLKIHGDSHDSTVGADKGCKLIPYTKLSHLQTEAASRLQHTQVRKCFVNKNVEVIERRLNEAATQVIKAAAAAAGIIKQQAARADGRCETMGLLLLLYQKINM